MVLISQSYFERLTGLYTTFSDWCQGWCGQYRTVFRQWAEGGGSAFQYRCDYGIGWKKTVFELQCEGIFMRILLRKIKFSGFQSSRVQAELRFSGSQTSIVYGHNGSGKTTLLKLLHAVLSKDDSLLAKERVDRVEIDFVNSEDELCNVVVESREDLAGGQGITTSQRYDWYQFDASDLSRTRSLSLGVDRGATVEAAAVIAEDIFPFVISSKLFSASRTEALELADSLSMFINKRSAVRNRSRRNKSDSLQLKRDHAFLQSVNVAHIENLLLEKYSIARSYASEQIQNALFDTLAVAIESDSNQQSPTRFPEDLGLQIYEQRDRIIEALSEGAENRFKGKIISILSDMEKGGKRFSSVDNPILAQLFWSVIKELNHEKQLLDSINTFIDTFNYYLGDRKRLCISKEGIVLQVQGENLGVEALSSGERHLFTFLALVVTDARERDLLIIDEPEISLNANWQRSLVKLLEDLAPETQIILASHSPILAKGQPSALVELIPTERNDG